MSSLLVEPGSIVIAMQKQLDVELIHEYFHLNDSLTVVQATIDLKEAGRFCSERSVSLAILDFGYPNRSAYQVGKDLLAAKQAQKVLLLDRCYHPMRAELALSAQAAYSSRNIGLSRLTKYVEFLAHDRSLSPNELDSLVNHESQWRVDRPQNDLKISNRELEVWTLIAEGLSVSGCAKKLGLACSTVDNHKSRLMKKLDVKKSSELTRLALRSGLVDI